MKIYSYNEDTNELLVNTLRDADYIDAATVSIPENSVIADSELPAIAEKQALIVTGERSDDGYFTVSSNVAVVEDHRGETVYSTNDGTQSEVKDLGPLAADVTLLPRPDEYHIFNTGEWVEVENADALRLADKRAAMPNLTPKQLKLILALNGHPVEVIKSSIDGIENEQTRLIAQYEWDFATSFERMNERTIMLAGLMGLDDEKIDELWEAAAKL